jgi:NADPH:quinone reductase-like Zn-dependent oxidoreductase
MLGASAGLVERLGSAAGTGKLKITIEKRVPFDKALEAISAAKTKSARGKTIIAIQE